MRCWWWDKDLTAARQGALPHSGGVSCPGPGRGPAIGRGRGSGPHRARRLHATPHISRVTKPTCKGRSSECIRRSFLPIREHRHARLTVVRSRLVLYFVERRAQDRRHGGLHGAWPACRASAHEDRRADCAWQSRCDPVHMVSCSRCPGCGAGQQAQRSGGARGGCSQALGRTVAPVLFVWSGAAGMCASLLHGGVVLRILFWSALLLLLSPVTGHHRGEAPGTGTTDPASPRSRSPGPVRARLIAHWFWNGPGMHASPLSGKKGAGTRAAPGCVSGLGHPGEG